MKFLKAVPIFFFVTSGLVSAAPVPFPQATEVDAREPIAPLVGIAAGLLPSLIGPITSGLQRLFGRDNGGEDLLGELAAIALLGQSQPARRSLQSDVDELVKELAVLESLSTRQPASSDVVARGVEDLDARRIVLPNSGELLSMLGRIAKGLFARDADTDELVKELELLQALASRQPAPAGDVAARDLDERRIVLPNSGELLSMLGRIAKGLFARDADTDELVKELELLQALSSRQASSSSDVVARAVEDIDAREPIAPLVGIAAGLLPSLIGPITSGLQRLFGRDASDDEIINELAALALLGGQRQGVAARSEGLDVKQLADLIGAFSQVGDLQARDPRIFPNNFGQVLRTLGGALLKSFTGKR